MSWPLPAPVSRARRGGVDLQSVDFITAPLNAKASSSTTTLEFAQVEPGYLWRVERIVITTTSAALLNCAVYAGSASAQNLRDWTQLPIGWSGVAEYPQFLTIVSGVSLTLVFSGTASGDVVYASAQYQLVQRAEGG